MSNRTRNPTARQLEAFRAVMIAGSMKRAAAMISVSQPAVSKIVKTLEDDLQLLLFVRRKGGLVPSEAAVTLLEEIERYYVGLERIARTAGQLRERRVGRLRVAAMTAMSIGFLPQLVAQFLKDRPGLSVVLDTHGSTDVVSHVRTRRYDFGIAMPPFDVGGLETGPVRDARCVCLLPAAHRLARRKLIRAEDLRDEPFISLSEDSITRMRTDSVFEASGIPRQMHLFARSPETACSLVGLGLGVAILNPFTARHHVAPGIAIKPFEFRVDWPFVCVRPAGAELTPLHAEFQKAFEAAIKSYLS